ncbi:hemolysin-III channel protein Izh2 [Penicillium cosmopolitanum]|uniref:Hemolysin-III channel protein Izh2 n=1 Tax=Penicillium cosmopolitanum TaxID=1131564 RepID=A0A9X0BFC4_9EURO|nr:hemolysin-III channel protein Izh2 [Penicillium cosmopolitanum]KAJ5414978.1 hemolysin-III channel protein Izh2 [Penicillium cosmopolitanum]
MTSFLRQRTPSVLSPTAVMEAPTTPTSTPLGSKHATLLSYNEMPDFCQDNAFILDAYRPVSHSTRACFASLFSLHNETINIYSHLIPGILSLVAEGVMYHYLHTRYPKAAIGDYLVFAFFLLTATICLVTSATYHTLTNHSKNVSKLWLRLDFVGIIIFILGEFVSWIGMIFYCESTVKWAYWAMMITLGFATILILMHPKFQDPRWRTFRIFIFVGIGLAGLAPLVHGIIVFGFSKMVKQSGMLYYFTKGFLLLLGTLFYTKRIPEALNPGKFDIFGASHQIFHILVVFASIVQSVGLLSAFDYNYHRTCDI